MSAPLDRGDMGRGQASVGAAARKRRPFRRDIEGLRAIAILSVVLYHAHVGAFRGGYVGVDVFFVISGFLITDLLWREVAGTGRLSFAAFYGRRIRRLLPMSFLVLAVTAVTSALVLQPLLARDVLKDGLACAFYVGNYHFALAQTDYLNAGAAPSPFQQYWSLGVEEQFYLLWPAVLLAASLVWRRLSPSRATATSALAALGAGSFALSLWLTRASEPWAFFSLPTRAWELALGGLVALGAPLLGRLRGRPLIGWVGLGLIAWSVLSFTDATPFPGLAALAPVGGAACVIAAGCGNARHGPVDLLRWAPMQVIGRISYSWYLWHWPVLILAPSVVGHPLSLAGNLAASVASLVLAAVSFVLVEQPLRSSRWLGALPWRSIELGTVLTGVAAGACLLSVLVLPPLTGHGRAPQASAAVARSVVTPSAGETAQEKIFVTTAAVQAQVARSIDTVDVPANLTPTLSDARVDEPAVSVDGCQDSYTDASLRPCVFGDASSPTTVVLFGDSHAGMWFPAVDDVANANGWRLIVWTKATCPPTTIPIFSPVLGRDFTECYQWRANVLAQIAAIHPALVILGIARHYLDVYHFAVYSSQWSTAMGQMVQTIRHLGPQVLVLGPVPKPPFDVPGCLATHLTDATACTVPVGVAMNAPGISEERAAVQSSGGYYVNTEPWLCTPTTCGVMVDNLLAYRDDNHLTATYAHFLSLVMGPELQSAIAGPPPAPVVPHRS